MSLLLERKLAKQNQSQNHKHRNKLFRSLIMLNQNMLTKHKDINQLPKQLLILILMMTLVLMELSNLILMISSTE